MRLTWDKTGEHFYETGDDHGVVYPVDSNGNYSAGYAFDGITGWTESPSGAEETPLYADNIKYLSLRSAEEFGATLTAYQFPPQFAILDGTAEVAPGVRIYQQARKTFGFTIRTIIGNDTDSNDHGYKLHLVYGLTASPSEKGYSTVNDSPEAIEFSWELKSVPVAVTGYKPTSIITIDSTKADPAKLQALEDILYGTDGVISYSEVASPVADSYASVTPVGTENPSSEHWYEKNGDVYTETTDVTVDDQKTYYAKTAGDNPSALSWYEKGTGDVYFASVDTSVDTSKTYYTKNETGGTTARLPLPDEVIALMNVTTGG